MKHRLLVASIVTNSTFCAAAMGQHVSEGTASSSVVTTRSGATSSVVAAPPAASPAEERGGPEITPMTQGSDHARMIRHYAVGYLGFTNIPLGALQDLALTEPAESSGRFARAPIIGLRYWATSRIGIDAGVGFSTGFGSQKTTDDPAGSSERDALLPRGVVLHGGAPAALTAGKHYVFELIPELNVGYATLSIPNESSGSDMVHRGIHLDVGLRAGAEIHFGFIGIPELSLVGSVGYRVDANYLKTDASTTVTDTRVVFRTTLGNTPWDLFAGGVSAFYYL